MSTILLLIFSVPSVSLAASSKKKSAHSRGAKKSHAALARKKSRPKHVAAATRGTGSRRGVKRTASRSRGARHATRRNRPAPKVAVRKYDLPPLDEAPPVVSAAAEHLGTPYRFGGDDPAGFDCSGLTSRVFAEVGVSLPHSARAQFNMGEPVEMSELEPGDLVFFNTRSRGPSHVGIYAGDGMFIHAPRTGLGVRVDPLVSSYYSSHFIGARRIEPPGGRHQIASAARRIMHGASYNQRASYKAQIIPAVVPESLELGAYYRKGGA